MTQTPGSNIPTFDGEENLAGSRRWVEIETPSHDGAAVMARANFDMMTVFRLFSDGQNCNAGDRWQSKMASVGYDFGARSTSAPTNVRFGSKADLAPSSRYVRSSPK